jgi:hypothetical protein
MAPLNRAVQQFIVCAGLALLIAYATSESATAQTASADANRRRAVLTQNSVVCDTSAPDPLNLGAISASVDVALDRQANHDIQVDLRDPSLSPLRTAAPNVNGEDEAPAQIQSEAQTISTSTRTKYSTSGSSSTSDWSLLRRTRTQDAAALRGQSSVHSLKHNPGAIRGAGETGPADNTSSSALPTLDAGRDLTRTQLQRGNLNGLAKTRHQQETSRRECRNLYLSASECRAKLKQPTASTGRQDLTPSLAGPQLRIDK